MRELKAEKVREMTEDEIVTRIRELHEEMFNLRFRNAMRQLQNPLLIRERKRDIARLTTILVEHRTGIRKLAGHQETGLAAAAPKERAVKKEPARAEETAAKPAESKRESAGRTKKEPKETKKRATKESKR
jgi:large subunit ribosomal protein L29